ncbi:MAG: alginate lyase family protein [Bryobacteraceae bacterium]
MFARGSDNRRDPVRWKERDEKKAGNHATWWTAKAAAFAMFTGDSSALRMAWDDYRAYLVPAEIRPDGSCPREEARTNSLSYSCFNLDAFAVICRLAQMNGVDLWHFRSPQGAGVETAFHYLTPLKNTRKTAPSRSRLGSGLAVFHQLWWPAGPWGTPYVLHPNTWRK